MWYLHTRHLVQLPINFKTGWWTKLEHNFWSSLPKDYCKPPPIQLPTNSRNATITTMTCSPQTLFLPLPDTHIHTFSFRLPSATSDPMHNTKRIGKDDGQKMEREWNQTLSHVIGYMVSSPGYREFFLEYHVLYIMVFLAFHRAELRNPVLGPRRREEAGEPRL